MGALEHHELVSVATHLVGCESCEKSFVEELRHRVGSGPFTFSLDPEFWFRHDHLEFEDLVRIADETLESELREIFGIHLGTCGRCDRDLSSLLHFRKLENESDEPYSP